MKILFLESEDICWELIFVLDLNLSYYIDIYLEFSVMFSFVHKICAHYHYTITRIITLSLVLS